MITVKKLKGKTEIYPILKIDGKGSVVLFIKPDCGTTLYVAHSPESWENSQHVGCYSKGWIEKAFTPFSGTLQLTNL